MADPTYLSAIGSSPWPGGPPAWAWLLHAWLIGTLLVLLRSPLKAGERTGTALQLWAVGAGVGGWGVQSAALLGSSGPVDGASTLHVAITPLLAALCAAWAAAAIGPWLHSPRPGLIGRWRRWAAVLAPGAGWLVQAGLLCLAVQPLAGGRWSYAWGLSALSCMGLAAVACACSSRLLAWPPSWRLAGSLGFGAALAGLLAAGQQAMRHAAPPASAAALAADAAGLSASVLAPLVLVAVPALMVAWCIASQLALRYQALLARTELQLEQAACTHALTGLPSRPRFEQDLQAAAMRADRQRQHIAVLCINVDGLKAINESFGSAAGDALLCTMARRLQRLAGPHDSVAHAAGDEFLMLLGGNPDRSTAARAAAHLITRLGDTVRLDGREVVSSCSVGLAMYPEDGPMRSLVACAGAAVRWAKRNGRASYCFHDDRMTRGTRDQLDLLQALRHAIERGQLELFYQPKVHAVSGQVTGAEALLRWRHPRRGLVSPAVFVPLAERSGLIGALGDWVIDAACRQIAEWQAAGRPLPVSINLSVHQLRQPDLVQRIRAAMVRHQVPPGRLRCEITESAAMDDTGATLALVHQLAAAGVALAVDDFGTGHSSLGYLRKLPVSELKIDRSFVMDLASSADARAIVDAVIRLAHALDLTVVAEGVETEGQCRILQRLGCDELQGYLFAKPMSARVLWTWAAGLPTVGTSVAC